MAYYSAINEFEPILVEWMNPELVTQNDISQKGENKYHILMHIYGI